MGGAVSAVTNAVKSVGNSASSAVGNVQKGVQQFGQGAQQLGSGDLRGLQTMGGSLVNTGSNLYGNMADINRAGIDAAFSPLAGTPLYGLTAGNLKGGIGSLEGVVRGNIAGIQDLPTDIGAGVQHGLDQIGGAAQDLLSGLGNALGGGGGGAGGGVSAPGYYKDLAQKQAEYGMNLPDEYQKYEGERFAAPGQNTLRGEGILAGRYDQRFGPGGTDPFAAATTAVNKAAGYGSTYKGLMDSESTLAQSGGYQTGLGTAADPNIFKSGDYTTELKEYTNPNKDLTNVNKDLTSTKFSNANADLTSTNFSNANADLTGAKDYKKDFKDLVNQSTNLYEDQVVNQTIADLNRARQMTQNDIGGQAAKAGAFGGSRQALLEAENNRNYLDRVAAATGQLRQQGFESAANRAQQENLQRLGLTAQDLQQTRGLQSQGNLAAQGLTAQDAQNVRALQSQGDLAAQGLTAQDAQNVRALQSQGGLAAQGLTAQDAQNVRALQSQGGLAAQGLQSQGALAALNANAGLYQSALGLNAAGDRSAMGYNAGLLSDAMRLDAADLNQRRNLASNEAQFAETANRGAGALNLQGGQALGQLAQAGTADERQRIADLLAAGQAGDMRGQQQADFDYQQFVDETQRFPTQYLNNLQQSGGLAQSLISGPQPQKNPYSGLLSGAGMGLATYGTLTPLIGAGALPAALGMGALGLLGG